MTNPDQPLNRLLQAAAKVPPTPAGPMPAALQTRVLAHRRQGADDLLALGLALLCRRALVGAALLMAACVAWSVVTEEPDDEVTVANHALYADLNP
jgi:hypothetical protein